MQNHFRKHIQKSLDLVYSTKQYKNFIILFAMATQTKLQDIWRLYTLNTKTWAPELKHTFDCAESFFDLWNNLPSLDTLHGSFFVAKAPNIPQWESEQCAMGGRIEVTLPFAAARDKPELVSQYVDSIRDITLSMLGNSIPDYGHVSIAEMNFNATPGKDFRVKLRVWMKPSTRNTITDVMKFVRETIAGHTGAPCPVLFVPFFGSYKLRRGKQFRPLSPDPKLLEQEINAWYSEPQRQNWKRPANPSLTVHTSQFRLDMPR